MAFILSVATAEILYVPSGTFDHVKDHGADVFSPILTDPLKNSTLAILPSGSEAFVVMVIFTGVVNTSPDSGDVIEIRGY